MQATHRRRDTGLIRALLRNPHRFGFFQTVRILERWLVRRGSAPHGQAVADRLRFPNSASLAFPASEIAAIEGYDADGQKFSDGAVSVGGAVGAVAPNDVVAGAPASGDIGTDALGKIERISLTPAFFGLLGAQGALPHYYTETLADHESHTRSRGVRAFLDIFSTRATALFYGAWKKYRLPVRHELDKDHHFLPLLLALGGLGHPTLRNRLRDGDDGVFDESLAHYAAALQQRPVSSAYLERVLADYFGLPVRIEPFVGKWYAVLPIHYTRLGEPSAVLGVEAKVGERVWLRNLRLRVWIGPLNLCDFKEFLPFGARARALGRLLGLMMGTGYEYEVCLVLRKEDVHGCVLDGAGAARLGYDTFLCTQAAEQDRDDVAYELQARDRSRKK
jgi:type VI secretion system protein ImpH